MTSLLIGQEVEFDGSKAVVKDIIDRDRRPIEILRKEGPRAGIPKFVDFKDLGLEDESNSQEAEGPEVAVAAADESQGTTIPNALDADQQPVEQLKLSL